jgi:dihydropteroate synthase
MGILNVTPDSFSDGGRYLAIDAAVRHGLKLAKQGADLVDVGGESTRPGAIRVPAAVEKARVLPVVRELSSASVKVSVDTMRAGVAEAAVEAGAVLVNDVSGGLADPEMANRVADLGTPFVAMHWRAHSHMMNAHTRYGDVVTDVVAELRNRLEHLEAAGIPADRVLIDPGLGFAKTAEQSWELLRRLDSVTALGQPILVGASRKSFLSAYSGLADRDAATAALTAVLAARGVYAVRVHDVATSAVAVRAAAALTVHA